MQQTAPDARAADARYESDQYWEANPSLHLEDAEFKVANCVALLKPHGARPASILDVGCGAGRTTLLLARAFGVPAIGIDLSPGAIAYAAAHHADPLVTFRTGDVAALAGSPAELGVMFDVFEHVEDYLGFLRRAKPAARQWVFNIPLDMYVLSVLAGQPMTWRRQYGHLHYFSKATALATLRDAGYAVVDARLCSLSRHMVRHNPNLRRLVLAAPRLLLEAVSPDLAARLVGGASLMVLAR
jgi:SAM-dependent methyltransferase